MPVSSRFVARLLMPAAIAVALIVGLAACAPESASPVPVVNQPDRAPSKLKDEISAGLHSYAGVTVVANVAYETVGGVSERLDVCLPPDSDPQTGPRPAIIEIHGGSWAYEDKSGADWRDVCEWLASAGYVTMNVDYRLAPEYPYPDAITDVETAVEWMREPAQVSRFNLDPSLIGAFGGSAGGNLAALLGTSGSGSTSRGHRVAAVAEMSGPINLTGSGEERPGFYTHVLQYLHCRNLISCPQAAAASPSSHIDATDPPFFVTNSTDELIPLSQSADFVADLKAQHVSVTFTAVPGTRHSIADLTADMRQRVIAFYRAHLRGPASASSQ